MNKVKIMLVCFLSALTITGSAYAVSQKNLACYDGERSPLAAPEMEQFEFLIGSFKSKLYPWIADAGNWTSEPITEALWEGEYILDGTAIADYWYFSDPTETPDTNRGVNTRVYNSDTGEWNMNWNSWGTQKTTLILKAKMIDGVLTMWQIFPEQDQKRVSEFVVNTKDHWTRYTYLEQGEERVPIYKIESYRIPCGD